MKKYSKEIIEFNKQQLVSEIDFFTTRRYELFTKHFDESIKTIIDYGCNTGRGGEILKKFNKDITLIGADIIKERLELIPHGLYKTLIDLTKESLIDKANNVDVIVAGEVVEHILINQLVDILEEFYTILNPNGLLMLTTPNPNSILVKMGRDSVFKDPSHVNIMSADFLTNLIYKIGFKQVKIFGSGKATKYIGEYFPILSIYGSYLVIARK